MIKTSEHGEKSYIFETDCVSANGEDITKMVDQAREITWETIRRRVGAKTIHEVLNQNAPSLKDDYAVSFWKSVYRGMHCYYIEHSAIEYVFTEFRDSKGGMRI